MKSKAIITFLVISSIIGISSAAYFYYQYSSVKSSTKPSSDSTSQEKTTDQIKQENRVTLDLLSKIAQIPLDEEPTIATVSDRDKLQDNPFFTRSENGDKVVIFPKSKRAFLFRQSQNKIIDIAPVNIESTSTPSATPKTSPIPTVTQAAAQKTNIYLYNGTSTTGLTTKYESDILKLLPGSTITGRSNASKNDYSNTLVIPLKEKSASQSQKLAQDFSATYQPTLPTGETAPQNESDILIIFGSDKE